jgi:hypothetical protein
MADGVSTFNSDLNLVPKDGTAVRVDIGAATTGQGNGGTSLPCKKVLVQAALSNAGYVMMNINAAATSVLGICLPSGPLGTPITAVISTAVMPPPLEYDIDDVSKLYFKGVNGDSVNIIYRR